MRNIVLLVLLAFAGCSAPLRENGEKLMRAERIMNEKPDSALNILKHIPSHALKTGKQQALFALLYSQALDKNYIDVTNDSLINIAVDYYNAHPEDYRLMQAHYYLSRIRYNAGEYALAILSAHKARKHAEKVSDYFFLGLIYRGISSTYNRMYNASEEVKYMRLSHQAFLKAHADKHADFALIRTGHAHHNNHEYEESIRIAQQSFETGCTKRDTLLLTESLHLLGSSLCALQKYTAGKDVLLHLQALAPNDLSDQDYKNLALAYFKENRVDSAVFYQKQIKNNTPAFSWINYEIHTLKGDYPQALRALEIIKNTQDSIIRHAFKQNINSTLVQYYKQEEKLLNNKLQYEKNQRFGILIFSLLLTIFLFVFYRMRLKGKQRKIEENLLLAQELSDKLKRQNSDLTDRNCHIDALLKQKFNTIDQLCNTYYACKDTPRERERIYMEVIGIISRFSEDLHTQTELETFINTYKDNLMSAFRQEFPKLKNSDYQLFLYYALGLSPCTISVFLQEKAETIYNRKNRLKNKIKNSNSNKKELFLEILS